MSSLILVIFANALVQVTMGEINIFPSNIVFLACMRYWTLDVSRAAASYEITLFRLPSAIGQVFSRLKHKFFLTLNMMVADHDI